MYNVRVKRFLDTEQIQIYSQPLQANRDTRPFDKSTGEIHKKENGTWHLNPFTDKPERMVEWKEGAEERSFAVSRSRTINKIYDIARSNRWEWFFTLTFNPEKVDSFDYETCTKKLSKWLNNMKRIAPDMKYLVVPEQHKSGRFHFHGLFANCDSLKFVDSGLMDISGKQIYNVGSYKLGFSTATKIVDLHKSCSYLCKYISKELCMITKGKKRYWASRNLDLPIVETYLMNVKELYNAFDLDECYVKSVCSEYVDVRYIEAPIYTTNTDFSKRYRQN